jgi:hypothetical protein
MRKFGICFILCLTLVFVGSASPVLAQTASASTQKQIEALQRRIAAAEQAISTLQSELQTDQLKLQNDQAELAALLEPLCKSPNIFTVSGTCVPCPGTVVNGQCEIAVDPGGPIIPGMCGSANGQTIIINSNTPSSTVMSNVPKTNLCASGVASEVTEAPVNNGAIGYVWTCTGNRNTVNCAAYILGEETSGPE